MRAMGISDCFRISDTVSNIHDIVTPFFMAIWLLVWITGPSASGSEKGMPSSIIAAPDDSAARTMLIVSSLRDMRKAGGDKGSLHQLEKDLGLTAGNFSNVELGRIEREFKDLQVRLNKKGAGPMGVLGMIKGAFNKLQDVTSDTYGGIDSLGKSC